VTFHNGDALDADDLIFSLNFYTSRDSGATRGALLRDMLAAVEKVDDFTIRLKLKTLNASIFHEVMITVGHGRQRSRGGDARPRMAGRQAGRACGSRSPELHRGGPAARGHDASSSEPVIAAGPGGLRHAGLDLLLS
jgi:hypothetical protein